MAPGAHARGAQRQRRVAAVQGPRPLLPRTRRAGAAGGRSRARPPGAAAAAPARHGGRRRPRAVLGPGLAVRTGIRGRARARRGCRWRGGVRRPVGDRGRAAGADPRGGGARLRTGTRLPTRCSTACSLRSTGTGDLRGRHWKAAQRRRPIRRSRKRLRMHAPARWPTTRSICCTTTSGTCAACPWSSASSFCARCCRRCRRCCTQTTSPPAAKASPRWRPAPASTACWPSAPPAPIDPGAQSDWRRVPLQASAGAREVEVGAALAAAASRQREQADVRFSNLDKVFWPEEGYTKGDLLAFYEQIADFLLPYLRDRPVHMKRFPDGIGGNSFFQRQAPAGVPDWVELVEVDARHTRQFVCNDLRTLLYWSTWAASSCIRGCRGAAAWPAPTSRCWTWTPRRPVSATRCGWRAPPARCCAASGCARPSRPPALPDCTSTLRWWPATNSSRCGCSWRR